MNRHESSTVSPSGREDSPAGAPPAFFEWKSADSALVIRLSFEVIDELNFEAMKGFGAIPRRGAEVGGILVGRVDEQGRTITIAGFQAVACKHARGPSYVLESEELENLASALSRLGPGHGRNDWAVGFFRSNTRETLELTSEDLELLGRFFPSEPGICLLVRPFATRISEATFFYRRDGNWLTDAPESVFPFRRKELGGGGRPRRSRQDAPPPAADSAPPTSIELVETELPPVSRPLIPLGRSEQPEARRHPETDRIHIPDVPEFDLDRPSKLRGTWAWIPLSFVFLLLGIVLGFQIAMTVSKSGQQTAHTQDPPGLGLSVAEAAGGLHLKWDANLPAFRNAPKGSLRIEDGNNLKTVEITREDIERGGILYRNATPAVRFRLEVPQDERSSVSEFVHFGPPPQSGGNR